MRILFAICFLLCLTTTSLAAEQATVVYDGAVLSEDAIWRGSVLVNGFVVVAPHATLRIEPGTIIRFAATAAQQLPNLIIQGRIQAVGTPEQPIILSSGRTTPVRGSWGGLVFVSTEKRNILEQCRIEYAETGIDVRYSTVALKDVSIVQARTALLSHDGVVQIAGGSVSEAETGIEMYNSEIDVRDTAVTSCQSGFVLKKSAVVLTSLKIANNVNIGLEAEECRIKITGGEFSSNGLGVRIKGGEGQMALSRFHKNRLTALHLIGAQIKIQRCLFLENLQDALRTEDGGALLLNNGFSSNGGYNLYNAGHEAVSARLNWWGTVDPVLIEQKISGTNRDKNSGGTDVFPWLREKPPLMP